MRHYKLFSILFKEKSQLATTLTTHLPLWEFFVYQNMGFSRVNILSNFFFVITSPAKIVSFF